MSSRSPGCFASASAANAPRYTVPNPTGAVIRTTPTGIFAAATMASCASSASATIRAQCA